MIYLVMTLIWWLFLGWLAMFVLNLAVSVVALVVGGGLSLWERIKK